MNDLIWKIAGWIFLGTAVLIIIKLAFALVGLDAFHFGSLVTPAYAHDTGPGSWINHQGLRNPRTGAACCGPNDCTPLPKQVVHRVGGGFLVEHLGYPNRNDYAHMGMVSDFIPDNEINPSADDQYWLCHGADFSVRCFMAPVGPNT
jgi:hypothetical protein